MNDDQLLRYSRHILLPEIDVEGQQALLDARALIVGAGGLGSPAAMYLAAAGVGTLALADPRHRRPHQPAAPDHASADMVGLPKVASARATLHRLNPQTRLEPIRRGSKARRSRPRWRAADVVLDCTDNFATRHAINRACVKHRKPLVSGAAIRFDGQVSVFDLRKPDSGCYHCLFPEGEDIEEVRCAVMGVFAPIVGIIGTTQAAEALKVIIGCGRTLDGRLLLLDGLAMEWRSVALGRDPGCSGVRDGALSALPRVPRPERAGVEDRISPAQWSRDQAQVGTDRGASRGCPAGWRLQAGERGQVEEALRGVADQHRRQVDQQFVHAALAHQRAVELEAGLDVQLVDAALAQQAQQRGQIDLAGERWAPGRARGRTRAGFRCEPHPCSRWRSGWARPAGCGPAARPPGAHRPGCAAAGVRRARRAR
jgi:molybdopterin/thiamine biosynthesis adenylyltransferase